MAFIEGEGSFFIAITHNRKTWYLRPRFGCSLHIDDSDLLSKMAKLFEKYEIKTILTPNEPHSQRSPEMNLTVRGVNQCLKLARLFLPMTWYSKKRKDFLLWCLALKMFQNHVENTRWRDQEIYDLVYVRSFMNLYKRKPRSNRNEKTILQWKLEPSEMIISFIKRIQSTWMQTNYPSEIIFD